MKNCKHIFFDLDDTLWDFEKNASTVLLQLFNGFGLATKLNVTFHDFYAQYKTFNAQLWQNYSDKKITKQYLRNNRFNLVFNNFGYDNYLENLEISERYLELSPQGQHLKYGCIETLNYLKQNYTLHIITNGFKEVQHLKIDGCGLRSYFKTIIISEEHQLSKPDVQIFRLAEAYAKANKEDCIMIGDNFLNDVKGALNAGWQAIYYSEKNHKNFTGKYISCLTQLKNIF